MIPVGTIAVVDSRRPPWDFQMAVFLPVAASGKCRFLCFDGGGGFRTSWPQGLHLAWANYSVEILAASGCQWQDEAGACHKPDSLGGYE
jgi:hypothetical protein